MSAIMNAMRELNVFIAEKNIREFDTSLKISG